MKSINMYLLHDASLVVCLSEYLHFLVKMLRLRHFNCFSFKRSADSGKMCGQAPLCLKAIELFYGFLAVSAPRIKIQKFVLFHAPMLV